MPTQDIAALDFISDPQKAAAVLQPLRLELLHRLRMPSSATQLSRQMGLPRQKVNYHLRELEKYGFVELVEERRKGNCVERIVKATARSYLIDPASLGGLAGDPDAVKDKFSSTYLVAVAGESIKDVAVLTKRAEKARKKFPTFTLQSEINFDSAARLKSFADELVHAVSMLVDKYHRHGVEGSRKFKLNVMSYPAITKKE